MDMTFFGQHIKYYLFLEQNCKDLFMIQGVTAQPVLNPKD